MINKIKTLILYVLVFLNLNVYCDIKNTHNYYDTNLYGFYELQGKRPTMEDAHSIKIEATHSFFGLFDGHGGRLVADYVAENLYKNIIDNSNFKTDKLKTIFESYIKTDADLNNYLNEKIVSRQGCTAVSAFIENNKIYIANTGDSRAVLCCNSKAIALSQDHKPDRADEKERIEKLGGQIIFKGCWRVEGNLALSRAIGDKRLHPFVIPDPEIKIRDIQNDDEFVIIACDGVWDVLSNQDAVDVVKKSLKISKDYKFATKSLVNKAYIKGSQDNISAIVINLKHS